MSSEFINGAKFAVSTTLAAAVAISATSNASPPVITASPMPANDDILLLKYNDWTDLSDIATFADSTGHLFTLDTTDTKQFPPGEGAGSYQVADNFVSVSQVREIANSGGDTNNFNWAYIDDKSTRQRSKPTDKNPLILTFTLDRDTALPWAAALKKLDRSRQIAVMRETLITGEILLYSGYISFQEFPSHTRNENMTVTATMSVNSDIVSIPANFPSGS